MKLRLGPLPETKTIRLTIAVSMELKTALDDYAKVHADVYRQAVTAESLIPIMLQAFVTNDRAFQQARRRQQDPS